MVTLSATKATRDRFKIQPRIQRILRSRTKHVAGYRKNEAANPCGSTKTYLVQFEGNNSKKCDGHDVELDGEWLESLYDASELQIPG